MWLTALILWFLGSSFKLCKWMLCNFASRGTEWLSTACKISQKCMGHFSLVYFSTAQTWALGWHRGAKNQPLHLAFRRHNSLQHVKSLTGNEQCLPVTSVSEQMERAIRRMSAVLFGWALQEVCPTALWTWRDRERSDNLWDCNRKRADGF